MGEKIIVGPYTRGLQSNVKPFYINNESFQYLNNAFQWRGRILRKRGTQFITRPRNYIDNQSLGNTTAGVFTGNIITLLSLETTASLVPGTISIVVDSGGSPQTFTDDSAGNLSNGGAGTGTINYASGAVSLTTDPLLGSVTVELTAYYYPNLPIMGLKDFERTTTNFPNSIAFNTVYSYEIPLSDPYQAYDVSFYKNPPSSGSYVAKTTWTPTVWNGENYQQFWTVSYQGALFTTNGINVPFDATKFGMQFKQITTVTVVSPTSATLAINTHGLEIGDYVFINEVSTTTGINMQTGYVTAVPTGNTVTVTFPNATIASNGTGGIAQYLTRQSDPTKDCIKFYDGDPMAGSPPTPSSGNGWVNFMPPLSQTIPEISIANLPNAIYYLVGARLIQKFKDRLLFLGPVIQTSSGSPIYLEDTILFSQNGTPFYTASFAYATNLFTPGISTTYNPLLVPDNQTAYPMSFWEDFVGYGGWQQLGIDEPITTISTNEDVLIMGTSRHKIRLIYTGNDLTPFNFYIINAEYGDVSTHSLINMDTGILTVGDRGLIHSSQTFVERFDLDIPDEVFKIKLTSNGQQRVTAHRDYINEWIYFSYPSSSSSFNFPNETLFYNYRDGTWAKFQEHYTTYGSFRKQTGKNWAQLDYFNWDKWNDPWESGEATLLNPEVIGGTSQGFIMMRAEGTGEGPSLYIENISSSVVTSPNHNLENGTYIVISDCLGTIGDNVNGKIFTVSNSFTDTFTLNPTVDPGTYLGGGVITRMYVPQVRSKQFPVSWAMGRKTRLGPQLYLFSKTDDAEISLLIFLSTDESNPYNNYNFPEPPSIVPSDSINNSLIYSTILYTCPESTNIGLTAPNVNLQMLSAYAPNQIWHRMNTSLIGDTIQIGFSLNDDQMREVNFKHQFAEIEFHGMILEVFPGPLLA